MTQQPQIPKVTECSICKKNGLNGVKIFLHHVGNNWVPTKANPETNEDLNETHYHYKFCRNNCGVVGFYDPEQKTFVERSSGERHDCPNYGQASQQQTQTDEQPEAKNIIEQVTTKAPIPDDTVKKIGLMWTLLTEDHKKIEDLYRSYKTTEDLITKFMESYQTLEAAIKTVLENPENLFKKSSEMRSEIPLPQPEQDKEDEPT